MKKFKDFIEQQGTMTMDTQPDMSRFHQISRISKMDDLIIQIEATLLGVQADGVTNSSELLKSLRGFRTLWEVEKKAILNRTYN